MNRQELDIHLAYDRWANRRLLEAARALPAEEFSKDLRASFGSVRGTLLHILWGEWGWLRYWQEGNFIPEFSLEDFPSVAALEASWSELEQEQRAFVSALTDEDLLGQRAVDEHTYTLGELIHHTLNHSTHHRGQVVLLSDSLGTPHRTRTSGSSSRKRGTGLPDRITHGDIDNGRPICLIDVAPPWPAEFVIFRIRQEGDRLILPPKRVDFGPSSATVNRTSRGS